MNEEVLKNNAEIYSSFEKLLISSEKYKDMDAKVKELTELSDRLNGEIDELKKHNMELNERAESIHSDEYLTKEKEEEFQKLRDMLKEKDLIIEKYKNTEDIEKDIKSKKEELKKIEISDLTYSFSSNLTLYKNFNLEINKGEIVGIVGNNGGGKSTLIKIIMKMIPIDIGRIIVNGKYGLENIDEEYLYKNISVVPQSTVILSGKLRDILNPAKRDISDNKIIETLKKFTVDYSIFENDLNYEILEKGGNMSGGEAQKLSLVRMVLENKPWVLLDEPTSAMDVECEKIICSILKEYLKRRTAVIITHRPEILSICDKIIRLES